MITLAILVIALSVLILGFRRARPYGKPGILAWLQSAVLMAPWLLFFGLSAAGIFLNLAVILILIIGSAGVYIMLGNQLRAVSQNSIPSDRSGSFSQSEFRSEKPISLYEQSENIHKNPPSEDSQQSASDIKQTTGINHQIKGNLPDTAKTTGKGSGLDAVSMPADDLDAVKRIFGIDTFYVTETVPYQGGAIFKGNLRGEAETVHSKLSAALADLVGNRYRLYALEGLDAKPVIVILPAANDPSSATPFQWIVAVVLSLVTLATCLETAGMLQGFNFMKDINQIQDTLLVGVGLFSVLIIHEIGHWIKANQRQIRLGPPFFIPTWQIGSFGALTRFESVLPNRDVLFDISIAGPLCGGTLSLGFLIIGLSLSHQGSFFQVPTDFFQGSILVGTLARVVLGNQMQQSIVDIHPLVVVGWLGLVITALNIMPAGQLDGGRIVQAIYGRRIARRLTVATLIVLGIVTLVNPLALYWAMVILFLQRDLERPSLNELTEPNDTRAALGLLVLFLMAAILLPLTPGLAGRLGIGG